MPILANAKKALRVSHRKAVVNRRVRSRLKTMLDGAKKDMNPNSIASAFSAIDRAVKRNMIHANKAARLKRQLQLAFNKKA